MTAWESEDEYAAAAATASLPRPTDIPYRTPSRASRASQKSRSSKRSSRQKSISPAPSSSPPTLPRRETRDIAQDESISILDPRRFTPTLHANLVSEILALRRDQEEKLKIIENLETVLHATQEENDQYQESAVTVAKETRGLKQQLKVLEEGGLYTLSALAKERDEAVDSNVEIKKRLEVAQKKIRSQEDDSDRVHDLWAKDKDNWEEEKRKLERKAHVAEGRLKAILEEVAAYQATRQQHQPRSEVENGVQDDSDHNDDAASVRTMSMTNSVRYSILSGPNGYGGVQINGNGVSLADELNFDDDDEDTQTDYDGGRDSVLSMRHQRTQSRESTFSRAHGRNLSHETMIRSGSIMRRRLLAKQLENGILEDDEIVSAPVPKVEYTDTGVQFSPPPSPTQLVPKVEYTDTSVQISPPPSPLQPATKVEYVDMGVQFSPPSPSQPEPKVEYTDTSVQLSPPSSPLQPATKVEYVDTGVQFSPPPSPPQPAAEALPFAEDLLGLETNEAPSSRPNSVQKIARQWENEKQPRELEVEANQRRKRVNPYPALTIDTPSAGSMVSAASQTVDDPLSPPRTPVSPTRALPAQPLQTQVTQARETASISTQTDVEDPKPLNYAPPSSRRAQPPPPILVPSIQLYPPDDSSSPTPREPVIPQHSKDAACQVTMQVPIPSRSVSVQTEEIRVDQRIKLLPPHLQPLSISSRPPSPEPNERPMRFSPVPGNIPPPRNPRRVMTPRTSLDQDIPSSPPSFPDIETRDSYPGNNDNGPLAKGKGSIRRPTRISSLFAGFENVSSDDADDFADGDMSDSDYRTPLSAPRPYGTTSRGSKRFTISPTSVPEHSEYSVISTRMMPGPGRSALKLAGLFENENEHEGEYGSVEIKAASPKSSLMPVRQLDKPLTLVSSTKSNAMRRAALISSGVAAHQSRSESPLPDAVKEPPFPIPTRASSRRPPPFSANSAPGDRSPTWGRGSGRPMRTNSVRKVRSAAALPRMNRGYLRQGSHSPPPMSPSTEGPESPRLPPMPENGLTSPGFMSPGFMRDTGSSRYRPRHRQQLSVTTAHTATTSHTIAPSVANSNQATTVVDAIAQTMVGEWMFKYVRRRKSFGVADAGGMDGDGVNGVRHKRWVWLAPYERAVMWSSKQPTSGSALMGKTGRKLTIQSVLDVKDDNPPPKGSPSVFDRSILILTPARALKFTASSAERHYVWLTALSFLAHSSQAVPEIVSPINPVRHPVIPDFEPPSSSNSHIRRNPIRDSIRVAKGKTSSRRSGRSGPTSVHSAQSAEQRMREQASFYTSRSDGGLPPADPPIVPRFTDRGDRHFQGPPLTHTRKRSNTGSRIGPPSSYRGFSGPSHSSYAAPPSTAGMSVGTSGSSDIYNSKAPSSISGYTAVSGISSVRTSEASNRPGAVVNNFFDAVGTVRMEAFISPMAHGNFDDDPDEKDEMDMVMQHRRHSRERRRRSRNRESYYSGRGRTSDDMYGGSRTAGEEEYGHFDSNNFSLDPFGNF